MAAFARVLGAGAAGRARHRPDGQHQRGPGHGRRGREGRRADGDVQHRAVPRQDQGLRARPGGHVPVYPGDVLVVDEATQVSHRGRAPDHADSAPVRRHGGRHVRPRAARRGRRRRDLPADRRPARVLPAHRGPPVHPRVGAGGLAEAARGRCHRAGRVRRPRPDLPRAAGPRIRRRGGPVPERLPGRPGRPADGHVERDGGHGCPRWSASVWPSSAGSARPRSRSRTATRPAGGPGPGPAEHPHRRGRADAGQPRRGPRGEHQRQRRSGGWPRAVRQTGPDQWSRPFFVPVAYLESRRRARPTPATCTWRRARPSTGGTWWSTRARTASLVYTGSTRGREKNTIHVVTGRTGPGAADQGRAGRLRRRRRSARRAALRRGGRPDLAREMSAADAGPA